MSKLLEFLEKDIPYIRFHGNGEIEKFSMPPPVIVISQDVKDEKVLEYMKSHLYFKALQESEYLQVIYNSTCRKKKCREQKMQTFYRLDRYPMSPRILHKCYVCDKGDIVKISNPLTFYNSLTKEDVSLKDLANSTIEIPERTTSNYQEALLRYWISARTKYKLKLPDLTKDLLFN